MVANSWRSSGRVAVDRLAARGVLQLCRPPTALNPWHVWSTMSDDVNERLRE